MSSAATSRGSAPFISKLHEIISNASAEDCIRWGPAGDTIVIVDQQKFAKDVLPCYFKHDNIRSFARQLNIYGFKRCHNPSGSLEGGASLEFHHVNFIAGRKDLMSKITRGGLQPQKLRRPPATAAVPPAAEPPAPSSETDQVHKQLGEIDMITAQVQQQIAEVDTQLTMHAQGLQSKMEALLDVLGGAPEGLAASTLFPARSGGPSSTQMLHVPRSSPMAMPTTQAPAAASWQNFPPLQHLQMRSAHARAPQLLVRNSQGRNP